VCPVIGFVGVGNAEPRTRRRGRIGESRSKSVAQKLLVDLDVDARRLQLSHRLSDFLGRHAVHRKDASDVRQRYVSLALLNCCETLQGTAVQSHESDPPAMSTATLLLFVEQAGIGSAAP